MYDQGVSPTMPGKLPQRPPEVGELVQVRSRRWLVEEVTGPPAPGESAVVRLACADDDAQGQSLAVFRDYELDRRILEDEGWADLAAKGFDPPRRFAAFLHTLRWHCVTATDPDLFQAPFRAGIRIDAYQMEPLRKALRLPRVNLFIADDTGLGKTIEAGLIARELLLRRKVAVIVVAAPPSVLEQWRGELEDRFGLVFEILDRAYLSRMRRERGGRERADRGPRRHRRSRLRGRHRGGPPGTRAAASRPDADDRRGIPASPGREDPPARRPDPRTPVPGAATLRAVSGG